MDSIPMAVLQMAEEDPTFEEQGLASADAPDIANRKVCREITAQPHPPDDGARHIPGKGGHGQ